MNIILFGKNGQLGWELERSLPVLGNVFALDRATLDVCNPNAIQQTLRELKPGLVINASAYTDVDRAEKEPELAMKINALAPGIMAEMSRTLGAVFIHYSTDYVFDGMGNRTYKEDDITDPVNLYGDSKLQGEKKIMQINIEAIIIRAAWVYSEFGKNFVKTMLRLMADKEQISVVSDQSGTPTYAADLAEAIVEIISTLENPTHHSLLTTPGGIYHYSNEGHITWYDFAFAIKELSDSSCKVNPIPTSQFPTPAKRPSYSVLDKTKIQQAFGIRTKDWKTSLAVCLKRLGNKPN